MMSVESPKCSNNNAETHYYVPPTKTSERHFHTNTLDEVVEKQAFSHAARGKDWIDFLENNLPMSGKSFIKVHSRQPRKCTFRSLSAKKIIR